MMDDTAYSFYSTPLHYNKSLALDSRFSQEEKAEWKIRRHGRTVSNSDDSSLQDDSDGDDNNDDELTGAAPTSANSSHTQPQTDGRFTPMKLSSMCLLPHNLTPPPSQSFSLRSKHIDLLSAILYKSIMCRDYPRAKRAFFLLLTEKKHQFRKIELRRMWEVGVEVLLRGSSSSTSSSSPTQSEGLKKAVEYLKRMILIYPWNLNSLPTIEDCQFKKYPLQDEQQAEATLKKNKRTKKRVLQPFASAVDFYPILIELLISHSEYCDAQNLSESGDEKRKGEKNSNTKEYYRSPTDDSSKLESSTHPLQIKRFIEEIMLTPPWINDHRLWSLRAMINMWMADLEIAGLDIEPKEGEGEDDDSVGDSDRGDTPESMISEDDEEGRKRFDERRVFEQQDITGSEIDIATRIKRRKHLLSEARKCFKMAMEKGGELPKDTSL